MSSDLAPMSRRAVLSSAGTAVAAGALTACGASTSQAPVSETVATTTVPPGPDAEVVAAAADVPVGSGVFLEGKRLVVTQPTAGDFHAFVAICTHQGCNITDVEDDLIVCRCHGSKFALDGVPVAGPAQKPLKSRPAQMRGTDVVVG
ncbi:Rieske (2Fe-2S) protein [Rhodococcus artemisiae]|uniref:Cytochrome bc1 complex Rieske iron-sulfur subunit n=1 Tax=Rhodococcus artemisiae TaxID=714159 RepID=A0ABU7LDX6_9NOCA|nr:Rieske (2Fe-2S) protein [Rhodococcus artemisiae]MEE2059452.1 Rieske (2Fe-2S) protein [Rhodococcus artemisiae]